MILKLFMEKEDFQGMRINYYFNDPKSLSTIAVSTNHINEWISLNYNGREYKLYDYPKMIQKATLNFRYPQSNKMKRIPGFTVIDSHDDVVAEYYHEAVTCGKRWIFNKNIGLTVFKFNDTHYMLFRVGFKGENSHYYCLLDQYSNTVAVIERHTFTEDGCRATLYIDDNNNTLISLIACVEEIISVANAGSNETTMDSSAGHYISLLEEEQEILDRDFINRVKARDK